MLTGTLSPRNPTRGERGSDSHRQVAKGQDTAAKRVWRRRNVAGGSPARSSPTLQPLLLAPQGPGSQTPPLPPVGGTWVF